MWLQKYDRPRVAWQRPCVLIPGMRAVSVSGGSGGSFPGVSSMEPHYRIVLRKHIYIYIYTYTYLNKYTYIYLNICVCIHTMPGIYTYL